jgi:nucleosome-remodeling factor subunit BPTF
LQSEAETIDEYLCPNCDSNSRLNRANMKSLSVKDHDSIKKLIKQILVRAATAFTWNLLPSIVDFQINRNSWPFKQPVDHNDVPNYYNIVKEPMGEFSTRSYQEDATLSSFSDLQTIENRVNQHYYERLCDFVGDITRIFENCRLFNQPTTQIAKCAESLESFFAQKLVLLREKIADTSAA